jgi:hypothetical protein
MEITVCIIVYEMNIMVSKCVNTRCTLRVKHKLQKRDLGWTHFCKTNVTELRSVCKDVLQTGHCGTAGEWGDQGRQQ